jgi:hypothetical protein
MRDTKTPSKLSLTIIAIVVVLAGATAIVWGKQLNHRSTSKPSQTATTQSAPKPKVEAVSPISYDGVEGKTALELLKAKATVITKDSSYGEYVDTVNGVTGGTDGKYWAFYVNGSLAQVGAADYQTKAGDKIVWKFE